MLKDPRVDPSTDNNVAIRWASAFGHQKVVKLLLKDPRVDPSAKNQDTIRYASRFDQLEVVRLLLGDKRVDPSACHNLCEILIKIGDENLVNKIFMEGKSKLSGSEWVKILCSFTSKNDILK